MLIPLPPHSSTALALSTPSLTTRPCKQIASWAGKLCRTLQTALPCRSQKSDNGLEKLTAQVHNVAERNHAVPLRLSLYSLGSTPIALREAEQNMTVEQPSPKTVMNVAGLEVSVSVVTFANGEQPDIQTHSIQPSSTQKKPPRAQNEHAQSTAPNRYNLRPHQPGANFTHQLEALVSRCSRISPQRALNTIRNAGLRDQQWIQLERRLTRSQHRQLPV